MTLLPPPAVIARLGDTRALVAEITTSGPARAVLDRPQEFAALADVIRNHPPKCANDPRFTRDRVSADDAAEMSALCTRCPARTACHAYADAADMTTGYWAGHDYSEETNR
ncbi:WhiB family transcriptional regulator [Microbacterium sp. UBA3394]|uniref:WhiB family transcriptional regulator n=1 Tax=Microbacterium sp. UBA3394 TaxID=1946945 RepID=UPI00257E9F1D|nr:WhiB family transcriptional regulator [Microbacterium sp. UBA3394]